MTTWLCPVDRALPDEGQLVRFVARDGHPIFKLPPYRVEPAGRCYRVTDTVGTDQLDAGRYTYRIEWNQTEAARGRSAELSFEIVEPPAGRAAESRAP